MASSGRLVMHTAPPLACACENESIMRLAGNGHVLQVQLRHVLLMQLSFGCVHGPLDALGHRRVEKSLAVARTFRVPPGDRCGT